MSHEDLPASRIVAGKYELVSLIGRGGMGSVWEARHTNLGTRVAIKFIEAEYANSQEARSRFDKEAKAAATIHSKHAIQIHDNGITEDGKPYIVMELLEGEPLDKRIDRLGRLTIQDTARILGQVCRGLSRAHERGIVHRDLKPENVFLVRTPDDDEEVAKVLDFGIAKIQGGTHNPSVTSSTKTGAVLGTPFYMSPEQARGLRNVDHRTDIWSIGVIAFKCLTGKLPFDGESVGDLLVKICTAPVPVPSHQAPGIPPSFDAWFLRALEREPDRRFSTVMELGDALAYAAGLAPRGPGSHQQNPIPATVGMTGAVMTPQGGQSPYLGQGDTGGRTPAAAAHTASPFTSSGTLPGLPTPSRFRWIAGAAITCLLIGGGATAMFIKAKENRDRQQTSTNANAVGIAPPAAASSLPAAAKVADPPPAAADPAGATSPPLAQAVSANPGRHTPPANKLTQPPTTKPTTTVKPPATQEKPPVVVPPPPPPATVPTPTPPAKKPPKTDPGY